MCTFSYCNFDQVIRTTSKLSQFPGIKALLLFQPRWDDSDTCFNVNFISQCMKLIILRGKKKESDWRKELVLNLHCLYICGQSRQANIESVTHGEDFLKVCGDHLGLDTKPPIRCNCNAVLPTHGHHSPSIIWHYRLQQQDRVYSGLERTVKVRIFIFIKHFKPQEGCRYYISVCL